MTIVFYPWFATLSKAKRAAPWEIKWRRQKVFFSDTHFKSLLTAGHRRGQENMAGAERPGPLPFTPPPSSHCASSHGLGSQWMSPGSVFGWAHWEKMCRSSTSSFMSTPGRRIGQHTPMLSHKQAGCRTSVAKTGKQLCLKRGAEK